MFGCTLFADAACGVDLCLLPPLRDLNTVREWDWGSPALAALYRGLDRCCRGNSYVQGYGFLVKVCLLTYLSYPFCIIFFVAYSITPLLQVWAYEHRVLEWPSPTRWEEVVYPTLARWGESTVSHDVGTHRARLNELVWDMVSSRPRCFPFFISMNNLL